MMDLATDKARSDHMPDKRHRLPALCSISVAMCLRDLWLAIHGGGVTPRPLLTLETAVWGSAALSGAIAQSPIADDATRIRADRLEHNAVALFSSAALMHLVRLVIYIRHRTSP